MRPALLLLHTHRRHRLLLLDVCHHLLALPAPCRRCHRRCRYGHAIVEIQCRCARDGEIVDLYSKLLRPAHIDSLMAAVEKHQVARLDLYGNQLGAEGAAKLAVALKTNTTVTKIWCVMALDRQGPSPLLRHASRVRAFAALLATGSTMPTSRPSWPPPRAANTSSSTFERGLQHPM